MPNKNYLGIEIGGTKLQLVIGDENARILQRFRFVVDRHAGAGKIRQLIAETLTSVDINNLTAIGVGYGGPIDRATGTVLASYQIGGWPGFPLKDWLGDLTGLPVVVDNDANAAAFGEALLGAGKDYDNVFYITLGSGVGSGIVLNKTIYHGAFPGEAEMGHVRLDKNGRTVESCCSGWAVDRKIRDAVAARPGSQLAGLVRTGDGPEAKWLGEAVRLNDRDAVKILDETCDDLAFGISHAAHLVHPEVIILGGGLSLTGESLRNLVAQKLSGYLMDVFQPGPPVQLSALKEDAVPVGALLLAIQHKNN
ncbi:MAG TPA: ROK family protein [Mucilaginibacter sp.]|jgi:glucokinase|nr:ROK family protein [Mucilaginibacter sp.]